MVNLAGYSYTGDDLKKSALLGASVLGLTGVSYLSYKGLKAVLQENNMIEGPNKPKHHEADQKDSDQKQSDQKDSDQKQSDKKLKLKRKKSIEEQIEKEQEHEDNAEFPILPELRGMLLEESRKILTHAKYMPPKRYNNDTKKKIYRFCLTGGPCAGKSTSFTYLKEKLSVKFKVFIAPEIASMTINGGVTIHPDRFTPRTHANFTKAIIKMQLDLEEYFMNQALQEDGDCIIFTDRGMLDNFAYATPEVAQMILDETGWTKDLLANHSYDAVFHLVTAADGAEEYFTLENNKARTETPQVARDLDKLTQKAWIMHQNHFVIDNSQKGFDRKMERLYNSVAPLVGLKANPHFVKKYLLEDGFDPAQQIPQEVTTVYHIEKLDYLVSDQAQVEKWLKERIELHDCDTLVDGNYSWTYIERHMSEQYSERMELRRKLNETAYKDLIKKKDVSRKTVVKKLTTFIESNICFMIEQYDFNGKEVSVLRVQTDTEDLKQTTTIPSFIKIEKDISEDQTYFQSNLANK